jgi:nucleoside-diphosphate-sugar epimerase
VDGGLGSEGAILDGAHGADAVFHVAAVYRVGIFRSERPAMYDANVRGTERVLDAAMAAGVSRIVHVSTVNVFGNTRGEVVDETYRRSLDDGFLSYYDETKYLAHQVALDRVGRGAPILIAQPGGIYGPGDTSDLATLIAQIRAGRLKFKVFPETGFNVVHVDDVAQGLIRIHDEGRIGESYVLGGELTTLGEVMDRIARLIGRKPPRVTLPGWMVRLGIPFGRLVARMMGTPPNLREAIKAAEGVTYWATDTKARRDLGYSSRDLDTGLRQTLEAPS